MHRKEQIKRGCDPEELLDLIPHKIRRQDTRKKRGGATYWNMPIAFDIETTSAMVDGQEQAWMWSWAVQIGENSAIGRTWKQFTSFLSALLDYLDPVKPIIYVFNLSFEFQFIRGYLSWDTVFSRGQRDVLYARTSDGIEFRDALALAGKSLATVAKDIGLLKLEGDLDYTQIRHSGTPFRGREKDYLLEDVHILAEYIRRKIEEEGSILKIPMTKTGYVRRDIRQHTVASRDPAVRGPYRRLMKRLVMTPEEFMISRDGFCGGFTHASPPWVGKIVPDVESYDIKSSYPAAIATNLYPINRGERVESLTEDAWEDLVRRGYLLMGRIRIRGLVRRSGSYMCPISSHKCVFSEDHLLDNGRVIWADELQTAGTNVDVELWRQIYTWDEISFGPVYVYERGPLPRAFVQQLLRYYAGKTTLKGVPGQEDDYARFKELLNSFYGMMVTDPCKDREIYVDSDEFQHRDGIPWQREEQDVAEKVAEMNEKRGRFSFYVWGVFVTAYARKALFSAILPLHRDIVYSDTDSCKIRNAESHRDLFDRLSADQIERCRRYAVAQDLPLDMFGPKDPKGRQHWLGTWDAEDRESGGHRFKTLGAKRYATDKDGISITVSGVRKGGAEWLQDRFGDQALERFEDGLYFPPEATGKLIHLYIDDPYEGDVEDYLGNIEHVDSRSAVHLSPTGYHMDLLREYLEMVVRWEEDPT